MKSLLATTVPLWLFLLAQLGLTAMFCLDACRERLRREKVEKDREQVRQVLLQMLGHEWISPDGKVSTRLSWTRDETFYLDGNIERRH